MFRAILTSKNVIMYDLKIYTQQRAVFSNTYSLITYIIYHEQVFINYVSQVQYAHFDDKKKKINK